MHETRAAMERRFDVPDDATVITLRQGSIACTTRVPTYFLRAVAESLATEGPTYLRVGHSACPAPETRGPGAGAGVLHICPIFQAVRRDA